MADLIRSWCLEANEKDCPFPLNNLPYGVFSLDGQAPRCGVALGQTIIDITTLAEAGLIRLHPRLFDMPRWNEFMALGPQAWADLRLRLIDLFREGGDRSLRDNEALRHRALLPMEKAELHPPLRVAEFTDFFSSWHHAHNVGTMFRGADNAVAANWTHMPVGYNGRASSVVGSGTPVRRPWGQLRHPDRSEPVFAPSRFFDFELELGAVVGANTEGPLTIAAADEIIFGYVLLNDWSARDIQTWESQPLGPFQSKATATTIGNWIVSRLALEQSRVWAERRDDRLLPYLRESQPMLYDIDLEVTLTPQGGTGSTVTRSNYRHMHYSAAQQIAHHTLCGCAMRVGDLLGSGTISGPTSDSLGCMLEMSRNGTQPVMLGDGSVRRFLEDGDTIGIRGAAQQSDVRIGFGDCVGQIAAAFADPYSR